MMKLLNLPDNMAPGISKIVLLSDSNELCDKLNILLQEKETGNNSDSLNNDITAIVDKLLQYKCLSKKQHKQTSIKCNLIHT